MFANILWAAILPESEELSWDIIREIIQSQYNLATYGLMAVIAVAALVAGGSWVTSFYLSRREVRRIFESLRSEMRSVGEENFAELEKKIKDEIERMEKKNREDLDKKMRIFDAEKARLFSLAACNAKLWTTAARWLAIAIVGYVKVGDQGMVRRAVNMLIISLKHSTKIENEDKKIIQEGVQFIPEILYEEKKQIKDMLEKLSKELPKGKHEGKNIT